MKIPKETAEKIISGTMMELWNVFVTLEGEYEEYDEDYEAIRFGIDVSFDIYDLWEETSRIIIKDKIGKVLVSQKEFDISDYRTEKENRRKIMANAISENTMEADVISPR